MKGRRLLFLVLWLAILDLATLPLLTRLEKRHYEGSGPIRFENSDLFGLGPLVAYLREHPRGERRRVVFVGNSMMFGYRLQAAEALPAQFEQQQPDTRVLNMAINGLEMGSSYLIAKTIIDSVDTMYVQIIGADANPKFGLLIPVDPGDVRRFKLDVPDPVEWRLRQALGRVWRLYGSNERIQTAIFGTSTRLYLYLHKRELLTRMLLPMRSRAVPAERTWPPPAERPTLRAPRASSMPSPERQRVLAEQWSVQWDFATLARSHRKRVVFLYFEHAIPSHRDAFAEEFNAVHAPFAELAIVKVPPALTYDGQHLTAAGCHAVGTLLANFDRQRAKERSGS